MGDDRAHLHARTLAAERHAGADRQEPAKELDRQQPRRGRRQFARRARLRPGGCRCPTHRAKTGAPARRRAPPPRRSRRRPEPGRPDGADGRGRSARRASDRPRPRPAETSRRQARSPRRRAAPPGRGRTHCRGPRRRAAPPAEGSSAHRPVGAGPVCDDPAERRFVMSAIAATTPLLSAAGQGLLWR